MTAGRLARAQAGHLIDLDTTVLVLLQQFEPVRDADKYGVGKDLLSRERILLATQLPPANQADRRAFGSTLSESLGLLDRGIRIPPAVVRTFSSAALELCSRLFSKRAKASCVSEVEFEAEPFQRRQSDQR
jgi:hypothetical protein